MHFKKTSSMLFSQKLILALLFLASMNLAQKCFYFIYAAFILTALIHRQRFRVDVCFAVLVLFSASYLLFSPDARSGIMVAMKHLAYPMCYLIGMNFAPQKTAGQMPVSKVESMLSGAIIVTAMGAFAHYVLNLLINIGSEARNTIDVWSRTEMGATGQAALAVIATGVFVSMLFTAKKSAQRWAAILGIGVILTYNMILAGRTLIVLMIVMSLVAYFYTKTASERKSNRKSVLVLIGAVLVIIGLYATNTFGIRTYILESNLYERMGQMNFGDSVRFGVTLEYLKLAPDYPFGGGNIRQTVLYYAHNLYLDVYNEVGIIGTVLLIVFMAAATVQLIRLLKHSSWSKPTKTLVLCAHIGIHFIFWLEPIMNGMPWIFCIYCFYQGMLSREYFRLRDGL